MDAVTLVQSLHQEITCSICLTFLSKPVTLTCGHSFCQDCLTITMENVVTHFTCPECRKIFHSFSGLNVRLSKLSAVCKNLNPQYLKNPVGQRYCQKHQQVPKLFCKEDQTSLCISCTEGQEHAAHTFSPIKEAAQNCRKKLEDTVPHLRKKIKEWEKLKISFKSSRRDRRHKWRKLMKEQYKLIHLLLSYEEDDHMDQLKSDEKMDSQLREDHDKTINEHVKNMEDILRKLDEARCKPDLDLLEESKELLTTSESLLSEKPESFCPELRKYPVTGMKNWLEKKKVNVTMDPRTASNFLVISEDLKKVKHKDNCPEQSNFPEKCHLVFAEQSFHFGVYYWEVDVKEQPQWALGVAIKSLRKKKTKEYSVEHLYMLRCEKRGNKYYLDTQPESVCQQMKDPMSIIGIYLDFLEKTLRFYDAINVSLICRMHILPFAKAVKPLFSPCPPMPGTTVGYMKICPL